ncbi:MAG: hypothetical protein OMM_05165 [Candidatus Magnetoglobus multicellularis str. Araruama]|uniref:TIR domain-containing protein n=1 Tax=Candidatus Magnetoglobus multicellularis str. Araruama TaxID=890399 RepID=A0A1V1NXS3_9BACT|nr:MAG: hypothetical protein OMM_05165 [Candidatus Magnetoglobus multicellularis str. Araruama]
MQTPELERSKLVDVSRQLSSNAIDGNINPSVILSMFDLSPGHFNLSVSGNDLWFQIVQAFHAGKSAKAGYHIDAIAKLVDTVANELKGNTELSQLAHDLGQYSLSNSSGQKAIFLSYSSKDKTAVDTLYDEIIRQAPTLSVFQDYRSISAGKDWLDVIRSEAGTTSIMACWLTKNYLRSSFCQYEIGIADARGATIIPVLAETFSSKIPDYISRRQMLSKQPVDFQWIAQELIKDGRFVLSPERAITYQPRATPWVIVY